MTLISRYPQRLAPSALGYTLLVTATRLLTVRNRISITSWRMRPYRHVKEHATIAYRCEGIAMAC